MHVLLLYLAAANLAIVLAFGLKLAIGNRLIRNLSDIGPACDGPLPKVSIIVPARNEQRDIERAARSLLALDYDEFEIIVVNDRSTDRTGQILDSLAAGHPRMEVVHVTELPPGWLGKNYALDCGAQRASGEWLLFTDADVVMAPATLRRAVGCAMADHIDHLTVTPELRMPGFLLNAFAVTFIILFCTYMRPWKAKDPASTAHVGIGAFNLIRADVYRAIGSHQAIAMRPDDDIKLGRLVKKNGYRQEMVFGATLIYVPWYASLRELIEGLMKNAFSGVEYRVSIIVASSLAALLFIVWPFVAPFFTRGAVQLLYAACAGLLLLVYWDTAGLIKAKRWCAVGFPLAVLLFVYIQWRAMLLTLIRGGVRWRDTHYPLAELKANKV